MFPEETVQKIASRTLLVTKSLPHQEKGKSLSLSSSTRQRVVIKVGINAKSLAEPLRELVPEVFDEIEKEEMIKSMTQLQNSLLEPTTPTMTSSLPTTQETIALTTPTITSSLPGTIQDTEITERSEEQALTTKTGDIVNDIHSRTPIAQVNKPSHVSSSVPAVLSSNTGPHPLPITSSLSGWEEFGAGHNAYSSELGTNSLIGDNDNTTS